MQATTKPSKQVKPTFFKLKSAKNFRFYNRLGQRALEMKLGQVYPASDPLDIAYFRAKGDVVVECTHDGIPLGDVGRQGHLDQKKAKSFQVYGRGREPSQPVPSRHSQVPPTGPERAPKTVQVGKPAAQPVAAEPPARPAPRPAAEPIVGDDLGVDEITPLEEVQPDGSTKVVHVRVPAELAPPARPQGRRKAR